MNSDPTFLGTIEDVSGPTIRVQLADGTVSGLSFIDGQSYRVGQVGGFVRIPLGFVTLYGIISQVGASAIPERLVASEIDRSNRWMTIQLVGEGQPGAGFDRGVSQYPTVSDAVHLVTEADLQTIYGRPQDPRFVQVGYLASAGSIPALVEIDKLVTRHSAVVGTTGSGKSTTVAAILTALSDSTTYPSARILVIDIHGEYGRALADRAAILRVGADTSRGEKPLYIPYWAMTFDELMTATLGSVEGADRGAVIDRITELKRSALVRWPRAGVSGDSLTVDTPVPFSVQQLWFDLHAEIRATHNEVGGRPQSRGTWALEMDQNGAPVQPGDVARCIPPRFRPIKDEKGDPEKIRLSHSTLNIGRQVDALGSRLRDPRFDFLFRPGPYLPTPEGETMEDLDSLLASWLGDDRPITILDLSGAPLAVQPDLVGSVLRILYDALFWARNIPEGGRLRPLLIVLEEAHAYLESNSRHSATTAVRRIAKEGRKYGIGMMLVSQRPSEIDDTILSQCGTIFALRLTNGTDRNHVTTSASENLEGLFAMLPILRTGEAIILGEAVNLPMRTLIDRPGNKRRPDSSDPKVVVSAVEDEGYESPGGWNQVRDPSDYKEAIELWRSQQSKAKRVKTGSV
jgi:uncharacterized protein